MDGKFQLLEVEVMPAAKSRLSAIVLVQALLDQMSLDEGSVSQRSIKLASACLEVARKARRRGPGC